MATAVGTYATLANVVTRMTQAGIAFGTNDNTILTTLCNQVNGWVEAKTGRILAPIAGSQVYLFNGFDVPEGNGGRVLLIPRGIRTITLLRIAFYTGATLQTIPSTDYFLGPNVQERDPGWPATELWLTDIPASTNPVPTFPVGINNIEVTGTFGWPAQPDEIVALAEKLVVAAYRGRASGGGAAISIGSDGSRTIEMAMTSQDWALIKSYSLKPVLVI